MITSGIRPLPYYSTNVTLAERDLAHSLRTDFIPKIARRLPGHHLRGFGHREIIDCVQRCKRNYPYFLRTDISRFYPSIRHRDLIVGVQLAYRDLLGLDYVPSVFKRTYVGGLNAWCQSLPVSRGIPLGSPLSAIAAPLMLVPVWLELKRRYRLPFLVYMDDVLVFCEGADQANEVYALLDQRLNTEYDLQLHPGKTTSGRFADSEVNFCGWSFAGGYARISGDKMASFRERLSDECHRWKDGSVTALMKRVNRKIYGFGHYYKYGHVRKQYDELDYFIRREVRHCLKCAQRPCGVGNGDLQKAGLASLKGLLPDVRIAPDQKIAAVQTARPGGPIAAGNVVADVLTGDLLSSIDGKLTQLISLQRRQLHLLSSWTV